MTLRSIVLGIVLGIVLSASAAVASAEPAKKPAPAKVSKFSVEAARAHKATWSPKAEVEILISTTGDAPVLASK